MWAAAILSRQRCSSSEVLFNNYMEQDEALKDSKVKK